MENPNTCVNLRRHNSLPPRRTSASFLRNHLPAKSNPYVGWFRHSPPITSRNLATGEGNGRPKHGFLSQHKNDLEHSFRKFSPYVGWFRHAPSSCRVESSVIRKNGSNTMLSDYLEKELSDWLQSIPTPDCNGLHRVTDLLSGHLYGGAPEKSTIHAPWNVQKDHHMSSLTTKLLHRVACWFLVPFQDVPDFALHDKICEASLEGEDSLSGACSSGDDYSACTSSNGSSCDSLDPAENDTRQLSSSSMMVSSQAEAYYAHAVVMESKPRTFEVLQECGVYEQSGENEGSSLGRLDYNITQMDIVRMTRNASRHLDVESILKLPTITYRSSSRQNSPENSPILRSRSVDEKKQSGTEEWSWMLVQGELCDDEDKDSQNASTVSQSQEIQEAPQDVCVICLEHFVDGDRLRVLPCDHSFHVGCIDRWLAGSHSFDECFTSGCPTCKKRPYRDAFLWQGKEGSSSSDGSVPSWAFTRIGDALARESQHLA